MRIENVLRGADPELFLRNVTTGDAVTSIGRIGGTKDTPRPIIGEGYGLQEDNVAVEFNIPPAPTKEAFVASVQQVLQFITDEISSQNLRIDISPTADFDFMDLLHPQAQELGCEPDYNAWTLQVNPRPIAPPTLRSSGGHLHIGYTNPDKDTSIEIIRAHDLFCGIASLSYDSDVRRREIYGKAGAHRIKPYGVEYRTLSNAWLRSQELMAFIYEQSEKAIAFVNNGNVISVEVGNLIQEAINTGNMGIAAELNKEFAIL